MENETMTKIEQAQITAEHRRQEWLKACQKVMELTKAHDDKVQEQIAKVKATAEDRVMSIKNTSDLVKTPEVIKSISTYRDAERAAMGLKSFPEVVISR
jgi:predicted DNA-binding ArsR family transcriptional regulator